MLDILDVFVRRVFIPLGLPFFLFSAVAAKAATGPGEEAQRDASFYYKKGNETLDPQEKIQYYRKAVELDPEFVTAYINLGVVYLQQQKPAEAVEVLERAYRLRPEDQLVKQNLSVAYVQMGASFHNQRLYTEAIEAFEKALNLDPSDKYARQNLSSTYTNMGVELYNKRKLKEAAEFFQKALDVDSNNQAARYNLSLIKSQSVTPPSPSISPPNLPPVPSSPSTSSLQDEIERVVLATISEWESQNKLALTREAKYRIVQEYLRAKKEVFPNLSGLDAGTLRQEIPSVVSSYLDLVSREGQYFRTSILPSEGTARIQNDYGRLRINSEIRAEVYVDGEFVGYSNQEFLLTSGLHLVSVRRAGYRDCNQQVEVVGGERRDIFCRF